MPSDLHRLLRSDLLLWLAMFAVLSLQLTWPARTGRAIIVLVFWLLVLVALLLRLAM